MNRRIVFYEQDSVGNKDWFYSMPYSPGDAIRGKLKRTRNYIEQRKKEVHKILRDHHGWIGEIKTFAIFKINEIQVSFETFYKSQLS